MSKCDTDRGSLQVPLLDDPDFLKHLVESVCQSILESEMTEFIGAEPYERSESRVDSRNGFKPRQLTTRVGQLTLLVPQGREGNFRSDLFARYQRNEKALVLALQEMVLKGVSTRKVKAITEKLCGHSFSSSTVSRLTGELDAEIDGWLGRSLTKPYPYLIVDARYEKIRHNGCIISQGVLLVVGVSEEGYREILAVEIANSETESSWSEMFKKLKKRGLNGVLYIVSDDHSGLKRTINSQFQGVIWQRCQFHLVRNLLGLANKKDRTLIADRLRDIWNAPNLDLAMIRLKQLVEEWSSSYPQLSQKLEEEAEESLSVFRLPEKHRKRMRTTNSLERFNQEIKRRTRVIRIFPNARSCLRLVAALSMEQSEEWITGHKYLTFEQEDIVFINQLKKKVKNDIIISAEEQFYRINGT